MKLLLSCLLLVIVSDYSWADHSEEVEHNPFEYTDEKKVIASRKTANKNQVKKVIKPRPWRPKLLATIVAGDNSLANVAGKVVKVGQRTDGYTLIAVDRNTATFEKDGYRYVLKMAKKSKTK